MTAIGLDPAKQYRVAFEKALAEGDAENMLFTGNYLEG